MWGEQFSLDLRMTAVSLLKKVLALEPKVRKVHLVVHRCPQERAAAHD